MKLHLRFHPQAWINDYAVDCDPEGEVECFVEFGGELPDDDNYDSDDLRYLEGCPAWWADWVGPFYISIKNRDDLEETK